MATLACGSVETPPTAAAALVAVHDRLLVEGQWYEARLAEGAAVLSVEHGRLPQGLEVTAEGVLQGVPSEPGEISRFVLAMHSPEGDLLESRAYVFATAVDPSRLTAGVAPPDFSRQEEAVSVSARPGLTISGAFAWDPSLQLAWPLRGGVRLEGNFLAGAGGGIDLNVAGPALRLRGRVEESASFPVQAVAQLVWSAQSDADLDLVMVAADGTREVSAQGAVLDLGEGVAARHLWDDAAVPGVEAVALSTGAPVGEYQLFVLRRSGPAVSAEAWLSVRDRSGHPLADERIRLLLSDEAIGTVAEERESNRQSWRHLGNLRIEADGAVHFTAAHRRPPNAAVAAGEG